MVHDPLTEPSFHLFTYGTRRTASSAAARLLLERCQRVADGRVEGTLYEVGAYPALLLAGEDMIAGEVWRCPVEVLPALDAYEGTKEGLFRRAAVRVGKYGCWIYVAGPKLGPKLTQRVRINSGKWEL